MSVALRRSASLVSAATAILAAFPAASIEFGLPADCVVGRDCFLQQLPDMDPGPGAVDPFCGTATYDGHSGTDLRVLSMRDMEKGVPVVAMADGKVLRLRNGEPDRLVLSESDRQGVADRECGNGLIVAHADGYETQYCHLRRGSVSVAPGTSVAKGDRLGEIGASGMAAFPHVHVTVRKDGTTIDPATGRALGTGCLDDPTRAAPVFAPYVVKAMTPGRPDLLAFGLAGDPIDYDRLVVDGPPPPPTAASNAFVAWAWVINLNGEDRLRLRVSGPSGDIIVDHLTDPVERPKAAYAAFSGRRGAPPRGAYAVSAAVVRAGRVVVEETATIVVD